MRPKLDAVVKERLRAVLDRRRPVTEPELRRAAEDGRACALILGGLLRRSEERLSELGAEPASSLAEIAATYREADEVRSDLEELHVLLAELQGRAREARASWVSIR